MTTPGVLRWRIQVTDGDYAFQLSGAASYSVFLNERRPQDANLEGSARRLVAALHPSPWENPRTAATLEAFGELKRGLTALLPIATRRLLAGLDTACIELELESEGFPWELACVEGTCLWERFLLGRRLPMSNSAPDLLPDIPLRAAVVSDPSGLLPAARAGLGALKAVLGKRLEVEVLEGHAATTQAVRNLFCREDLFLIHLDGHVHYDPACPERTRFFLSDGAPTAAELTRSMRPSRMVSLNLLHTGRPLDDPRILLRHLDVWARAFLEAGAATVVGPLWDVGPERSQPLFVRLFHELVRGATAIEALQTARKEAMRSPGADPCLTPHAYVLYGDLWTEIPGVHPDSQRQPGTVGSQLRPTHYLEVVDGPESGRTIPLFLQPGSRITLGSTAAPVCDLELEDSALEGRHAVLEFEDHRLVIRNLSGKSEGLRINGLRAGNSATLEPGDRVELGQTVVLCRIAQAVDPGRNRAPETGRYRLVVVQGLAQDLGRHFLLEEPFVVIGRNPDCGVRLHDPSVSRRHVSLIPHDGRHRAVHVGSGSTVLQGMPLETARLLSHGDLLQLSHRTVLRYEDSAKGSG